MKQTHLLTWLLTLLAIGQSVRLQAATSDPAILAEWQANPGEITRAIDLKGQYAFIAADTAGVIVLDVTDPSSPIRVTDFPTPPIVRALRVFGNELLLTGEFGLKILDVSDPLHPQETHSLNLPIAGWWLEAFADLIYITGNGSGHPWQIVQRDMDGTPAIASSLESGLGTELLIDGNQVYYGNYYGGLKVYDITNPLYPSFLADAPMSSHASYLSLQSSNLISVQGFHVETYDISNPSTVFRETSQYIGQTGGFADFGPYLLIGQYSAGTRVMDVSDPLNPTTIYNLLGYHTHDAVASQGLIYAAVENGVLILLPEILGIESLIPPNLTCPGSLILTAEGECSAPIPNLADFVSISDNTTAPEDLILIQSLPPGTPLPLGDHSILVSVIDQDNNQAQCEMIVSVLDGTPPIITNFEGPSAPLSLGTSALFATAVSDNCSIAEASWDWGNGTTSAATYDETLDLYLGSNTYSSTGVYTVTFSCSDIAGNESTKVFQFVVVYDPNGAFVTGGGQIISPPGAYILDPGLNGKAHFGFVAKYKKGATVPTGNTAFQFQAGNFRFKSTEYDWLVVAGASAKYKGYGTINGQGAYPFMVTARDGDLGPADQDTFRIKISDPLSGVTIYDNKIGTADESPDGQSLSNGNIVIHSP